ncbi:hypothetical protein RMSM_02634 [Rhodopirellula maiorica SM1]|uniref:Uncharacterized protein n=1 Tax=Rhodopirellula maiorica SM1 TaxID=1265738 RepID=M5RMK9_9BACT|nr:hypothetical protein [Rhodopirellula maiorica]EMI20426.1 hypothetical protein RMSM_02634 [Rhodopirellula maiorica SM1]
MPNVRDGNQCLVSNDASEGYFLVGVPSQQLGVAAVVWQNDWLHFSVPCDPAQLVGDVANRTATTEKAANRRADLWLWRFTSMKRNSFRLDKVTREKIGMNTV